MKRIIPLIGDMNKIQLEMPKGYSIRYAFSNLNNPEQIMVVLIDSARENEIAMIIPV